MDSLKGKVAIVTGASRGIGRGIALKLAAHGCDIAFNYKSSDKEASDLKEEIVSLGVRCIKKQVDIVDFDAVKEWVESVKGDLGRIDILVNNAGIIDDKALMMMGKDQWHNVIDTNLNGMFNVSRHCIVSFMKQKSGHIINISSISGVIGLMGQTNYSASKGGMNAFTKALAKEVAKFNVKVNAIAPGFIETDIISKFSNDQLEQIKTQVPLGRVGSIDDVANCVLFLTSKDARYITGQVIIIDGGLSIS